MKTLNIHPGESLVWIENDRQRRFTPTMPGDMTMMNGCWIINLGGTDWYRDVVLSAVMK